MTKEQPLALVNDGMVPTLSPDALTIKRNAVELAQSIVTVSNAQEQQDCIAAASLIKGVLKRIEAAYRAAKAEPLKKCQTLDALNRGLTGTIQAELDRIEDLAGAYQGKVEQAADELKAQELLDMAASTDMSEDAMRARANRLVEISQPIKVTGAQFKSFTDYTVEDALALANARPDLVTIEVKRRELLAYLSIPNVAALPGISIFTNQTLHAKAS